MDGLADEPPDLRVVPGAVQDDENRGLRLEYLTLLALLLGIVTGFGAVLSAT